MVLSLQSCNRLSIYETYSFSDGDGDVLHGVTGVRVECSVYVNIAHHSQLRVGLDVVVDVYLNCRDNSNSKI